LPEHCFVPGVHATHMPFRHAGTVPEHATGLPHSPFDPHDSTLLPEHWTAPGVHCTHAPFRQAGSLPEQATGIPHCPVDPHVSTPLGGGPPSPGGGPPSAGGGPPSMPFTHCVAPGEQTPVHAPFTHAWALQVVAEPHWPDELHTSIALLPEHCVVPGEHATHAPLRHTGSLPEQPTALPYWPFDPQVSTPPSEHIVAPGEQTPVHAPPLHTKGQDDGLPYCPLELHTSTALPEHCVAPGMHDPEHVPALHTFVQGEPLLTQAPALLHTCGCSGFELLHCIEPGTQVPVHMPALHT
jgi:hypothetical protein